MDIKTSMEKFKEFAARIRRYLDVTILIVPHNGTKTRRLPSGKAFILLWIYSLIVVTLGFFAASLFTDMQYVEMSQGDVDRIKTLNERVEQLTIELEGIRESNRRMKNAIMLADSSVFQPKKIPEKKKLRAEGSLYSLFRHIVYGDNEFQAESYYFIRPAEGFMSRGFNPGKGHFGIDIVLKTGNPVYASGSGYVAFADYTPEDGYMVIINHSSDFVTVYKHCSSVLKKQRDNVATGEVIALSGNTGDSSGPHLHFEIWERGVPKDPAAFFINK